MKIDVVCLDSTMGRRLIPSREVKRVIHTSSYAVKFMFVVDLDTRMRCTSSGCCILSTCGINKLSNHEHAIIDIYIFHCLYLSVFIF